MSSSPRPASTTRQRLCVLGATGSVGQATLDVAGAHPDRFEIFALTAHQRLDDLLALCVRHQPRFAAVASAAQRVASPSSEPSPHIDWTALRAVRDRLASALAAA